MAVKYGLKQQLAILLDKKRDLVDMAGESASKCLAHMKT